MSELKARSGAPAAAVALLAAVLALAGCGGPEPSAPAPLDPSAGPPAPTTTTVRRVGVVRLGDAPAYVALAAKDVTVNKGTAKKGKVEKGDPVEGGLKADVFKNIGDKGLAARITTDADNKTITGIIVTGGKK